ncbi:MAG TPA: hypothetical protein VNN74_05165 [Candidatus Micrarchaeia archaeon]|nr:hypothetical protein [Candidatus Micrarchaeia archaeon]
MAFKRATLGGSQDLFQPTRPGGEPPAQAPGPEPAPGAPFADPLPRRPVGHLYRLTAAEVALLLQALQQAKFPHSYQRLAKPGLDDFEELEAVRQSLLRQQADRA